VIDSDLQPQCRRAIRQTTLKVKTPIFRRKAALPGDLPKEPDPEEESLKLALPPFHPSVKRL
jgi:hypothetical protein